MLCPRDGKCEYDGFKICGVHVCAFPRCIYREEYRQALIREIAKTARNVIAAKRREQLIALFAKEMW